MLLEALISGATRYQIDAACTKAHLLRENGWLHREAIGMLAPSLGINQLHGQDFTRLLLLFNLLLQALLLNLLCLHLHCNRWYCDTASMCKAICVVWLHFHKAG